MKTISVIGLGYVGLPIAVAFAKKGIKTIGFDINEKKINQYLSGIDPTNEVGSDNLVKIKDLIFTSNSEDIKRASFHIVAVPTPVTEDCAPDLRFIISASELLSKVLKKDDIVVYESTVYPGVTEEVCAPILEEGSGLTCGIDFKIGYSPERINPGDKKHRLENIVKIISGIDQETVEAMADVYNKVVDAGLHKASSIKVAEAAKVIENSQRDINIAFMNELSLIFDKMNIDTKEVLEAASTKWNFLKFYPGLVGGHCIGVDPYYLTYKAKQLGYDSKVILAGRNINDSMGKYIAEKTVKKMIEAGVSVKNAKVGILGLTFKENCPDLRNSKVFDIVSELRDYSINVLASDCVVDCQFAKEEYNIDITPLDALEDLDAIILAVAHNEYKKLNLAELKRHYNKSLEQKVLIDVKGILDKEKALKEYLYWRL